MDAQAEAPELYWALYYPWIVVRDENWLKSSLLFWDSIAKIVPGCLEGMGEGQLRPYVAEGMLRSVDPGPYAQDAEERFRRQVLPGLDITSPMSGRLLAVAARCRLPPDADVNLHVVKLAPLLTADLCDRGLMRRDGDGILAERALGGMYMHCLASAMSEKLGAPPVTDDEESHEFGECLRSGTGPLPGADAELAGLLVKLGFKYAPAPQLGGVTVRQLIRFRERYRDERRNLLHTLREFGKGMAAISDPDALLEFVREKREDAQHAFRDHQRALDAVDLGGAVSALDISSPACVAGGAAALMALAADLPRLAAGTGLAVAAVGWWSGRREQRRAVVAGCPWHYLLRLHRSFPELGFVIDQGVLLNLVHDLRTHVHGLNVAAHCVWQELRPGRLDAPNHDRVSGLADRVARTADQAEVVSDMVLRAVAPPGWARPGGEPVPVRGSVDRLVDALRGEAESRGVHLGVTGGEGVQVEWGAPFGLLLYMVLRAALSASSNGRHVDVVIEQTPVGCPDGATVSVRFYGGVHPLVGPDSPVERYALAHGFGFSCSDLCVPDGAREGLRQAVVKIPSTMMDGGRAADSHG